jgi:uncharacterized repeat protein (TIGR01451 family)
MIYSKAKTNLFLSLTITIGILCVLTVFSHSAKSAPHPVSSPPELIWRPALPLRSTLARFTMAVCDVDGLGEVIYVIGGVKEIQSSGAWILSDSVQHATLEPDGRISPWQQQRFTEMELYGAAAIAYAGRVYVIGGGQDSAPVSKKEVYYAQPTSTGDIISWTLTSSLPIALHNHAAVELDGRIYLIGGFNETRSSLNFSNKVLSSAIQPDGSLLPWQEETELLDDSGAPYGIGAHAVITTDHPIKAIYVFGGEHDWASQKAVYRAFVNPNGSLDAWEYIGDLPLIKGATGLRYHSAVLVGEKVFIIGGEITAEGGKSSSDQIYVATISETGDLDWTHTYTLPAPREQLASVAASNGTIFVAGGRKRDGSTKHYYDNVWAAPIAFFTKSHHPQGEVTYGDIITYRLDYRVNAVRDLPNVTISDPLPSNTEYVALSLEHSDALTCDDPPLDNRIFCTASLLLEGATGHVSFQARVVPPTGYTGASAVLPNWFVVGRSSRADTEATYVSQNLALDNHSPHRIATLWPNSISPRTYYSTNSNLASIVPPTPMPVPPATHTTWAQTCAPMCLEVLGTGMSDTLLATLTIPDLDSIVGDSMRIQVALKIQSGGEIDRIAKVILSTHDSSFLLTTPTSVDDFMAVYELDVPVSEVVTAAVVPLGEAMTRADSLVAYFWREVPDRRSTSGWTGNGAIFWRGAQPLYSRNLFLPPLTDLGDVTVHLAGADNDPDGRAVHLKVEAGGVTATKVITTPSHGNYLDIHSLVLTNVPAGTSEIVVTIESPPDVGDSFGLLGAMAEVACPSAPTILNVHPDILCNDVENELTIDGTQFVATPRVQLGNTELSDVAFISSDILTATLPSGMPRGVYSLTVTNPGNGDLSHTLTNAITVAEATFSVTGMQPDIGTNDRETVITVTGENLLPTPTLRLDGQELMRTTFLSSTAATTVVPSGLEPGYYHLTVINGPPCERSMTMRAAFTMTRGPFSLNAVSPTIVCDDERTQMLTITGEAFPPEPIFVFMNDTPLQVTSVTSSEIRAIVPGLMPTGIYSLTVLGDGPCEDSTGSVSPQHISPDIICWYSRSLTNAIMVVPCGPIAVTNVAYLCIEGNGCISSNLVINTPYNIYLPIVMRNACSPLTNGDFETTWTGWLHGGELNQSVTSTNPYSGTFSALLGDPTYNCRGDVPQGSAWMEQTFSVPDTVSPTLSFRYNIFTHDKNSKLDDIYDRFDVKVNGTLVISDMNTTDPYGCDDLRDLGWQQATVELGDYAGTCITLRFENWNRYDGWYNTWTYVDDVQVTP